MTSSTPTKNTNAFFLQAGVSFAVALLTMIFAIFYLPVDPWIRAFLGLGTMFLTTSSFTLAKCVRDAQEDSYVVSPHRPGPRRPDPLRARPLQVGLLKQTKAPSRVTGRGPSSCVSSGLYLSSALVSPSTRRATISCWICWVPSKMSRILESRRPLLQQLALAVAEGAGQLDAAQRDVGADAAGLGLGHRGLAASWACGCRPSTPPAGSAGTPPPSRPRAGGTSPRPPTG